MKDNKLSLEQTMYMSRELSKLHDDTISYHSGYVNRLLLSMYEEHDQTSSCFHSLGSISHYDLMKLLKALDKHGLAYRTKGVWNWYKWNLTANGTTFIEDTLALNKAA